MNTTTPIELVPLDAAPSQPLAIAPQLSTPMDLARIALSSGRADIDQLERLMKMHREWKADEARTAYHAAIAKFKTIPLRIVKDKLVDFPGKNGGRTTYMHATIGNVVAVIVPALAECGLSHAWSTTQDGGSITVTCRLTHERGHSESVSLSAGRDDSGNKNPIQQVVSTQSYLQRHTLLAITGLATEDQHDNDGAGGDDPPPQGRQEVPTWPDDIFAAQFARWAKAVADGTKTRTDIFAFARSKGALTAAQEAQINTLGAQQ